MPDPTFDDVDTLTGQIAAETSAGGNTKTRIANAISYLKTAVVNALSGKASTTHKSAHATGQSDALSPSDIGAAAADHDHDSDYAPAAYTPAVGTDWPDPENLPATPAAGLDAAAARIKVLEDAEPPAGLANLTETLYTAAPNDTVNAAQLEVTEGSTNADLVLGPKGTGAFIVGAAPDGATPGGNKRGAGAVDLQLSGRDLATRVASGANAVAAGLGNTASGATSVAVGSYNTASGGSAVALGNGCSASGANAFAAGENSIASGAQSVALGYRNNALGQGSVALGNWSSAQQWGQLSFQTWPFDFFVSDNQFTLCLLHGKTSGDTPAELFLDGSSVRLAVASGRILHAVITLTGAKSDGSAVARYLRQVTIKNVAGTTALVGSVIAIGTDEAAGTSIAITADDTNDALAITVTGIAEETWRWVAVVDGAELAYGT